MLDTIRLRNFKCFEDSKVIELSRINVFTGYNGAGKSSVFQSILLLAQSVESNEITRIRANGKYVKLGPVDDLVFESAKDKRLNVQLKNSSPDYSLDFSISPMKENDRLGELTGFILNGQDQFSESAVIGKIDTGAEFNEVEHNEIAGRMLQCADWGFLSIFKNINYISAGRLGPTLFEERAEVDLENPIGERGEHRLEVLRSHPEIIRNIEVELSYIMESDVAIKLGESEESHSILNLSFQCGESRRVKSVNTGFGFSYILPLLMVAECQKDGKIFIENPEAHLHPGAQSRLMQVLVKRGVENNNQVFVETHSEHIINGLRLACLLDNNPVSVSDVKIYFFNNKDIIPLEIDKNAQLSPWPEGFFDQQQKDSSEILRRGLLK